MNRIGSRLLLSVWEAGGVALVLAPWDPKGFFRIRMAMAMMGSPQTTTTANSSCGEETKWGTRLLCVFRMRYIDFRLAEVEALEQMACGLGFYRENEGPRKGKKGTMFKWEAPKGGEEARDGPFWYLRAPTREAAEKLAAVVGERGVLVKCLVDLWSEGDTLEAMALDLRQGAVEDAALRPDVEHRKSRVACFSDKGSTFKFSCEGFGRRIPMQEQLAVIDVLCRACGHVGKVSLKQPQYDFYVGNTAVSPKEHNLPSIPDHWYFGLLLCRTTTWYDAYKLSERKYLGPTSMDHEVAALMANMAQCRPGKLAFDPYVGTGSILVACSHAGAMTYGGDIDVRVIIWGKEKECCDVKSHGEFVQNGKVDVWTNFDSYGLPRPLGLIRCDASSLPFRRQAACSEDLFDAVVCDPPYGIRAGGRKQGGRQAWMRDREVPEDRKDSHIPSTAAYSTSECVVDLLDLSARHLVVGGRLVYFFPSAVTGEIPRDWLPSHPCLEVEHCCEQELTMVWGRKLVTMVKRKPYDPDEAGEHRKRQLALGSDLLKFDRLYELVHSSSGEKSKKVKSYKGKKI